MSDKTSLEIRILKMNFDQIVITKRIFIVYSPVRDVREEFPRTNGQVNDGRALRAVEGGRGALVEKDEVVLEEEVLEQLAARVRPAVTAWLSYVKVTAILLPN